MQINIDEAGQDILEIVGNVWRSPRECQREKRACDDSGSDDRQEKG
jgi:hypothetical protein